MSRCRTNDERLIELKKKPTRNWTPEERCFAFGLYKIKEAIADLRALSTMLRD